MQHPALSIVRHPELDLILLFSWLCIVLAAGFELDWLLCIIPGPDHTGPDQSAISYCWSALAPLVEASPRELLVRVGYEEKAIVHP